MAAMVYVGLIKPNNERLSNRLELTNEFYNQIVCFHQFFYTDMVDSP
jgi:hypothetical protein